MNKLGYLVIVLGLLGFGCTGGTETGNPPASGVISLGLTAFSSAPSIASLDSGAGLAIDRVAVHLGTLNLTPCATGAAVKFPTGEYDLTSGTTIEVTGIQDLCDAQVELTPAEMALQVLPAGVALYIHGHRTDGSEFDVESTTPQALSLSSANAAQFGKTPLLLGLDLGVMFSGVDVHSAHAGADGIARLNAALNPAPLAALEHALSPSLELYADSNANGVLDAGELTPVASP